MDSDIITQPNIQRTGGMRNVDTPTPALFPPPESMRPTLVGRDYVVSAGHPIVAQVMSEILAQGGTAIDAGVAGGLLSNVVQVDMCNFGGVAPTLIRLAEDDCSHVIDGVGCWGHEVTLETFVACTDGDMPLGSPVGVVPAAFDVWCRALSEFGTMRLAEVIAPAINYARHGFPLDQATATALRLLGTGFSNYASSTAIYWPQGRPPKAGEILKQIDLATTLSRLAACDTGQRETGISNARNLFYQGEIAQELIAFHRERGGWLTREDLAEYESPVEIAPSVIFKDWEISTPGIVGQGPVLLQALGILNHVSFDDCSFGSTKHLHYVAEALKQGFAEREAYYADPKFTDTSVKDLLRDDHLKELFKAIHPDKVLPGCAVTETAGRGRCDTTYLAAADAQGNIFSSMPSDTIDGAPIIPNLGFFVSPRGVQSRLEADHPACIAPGKRPRLTPAPAIAVNYKTDEALAIGCPGGDVIVQSMLQSFLNMICFDMTPQQAVEAPRIATFSHPGSFYPHPSFPRRLSIEGRIDTTIRNELKEIGHIVFEWPDWEFDAGGVAIAGTRIMSKGGQPVLVAAADPRRSTYAAGR